MGCKASQSRDDRQNKSPEKILAWSLRTFIVIFYHFAVIFSCFPYDLIKACPGRGLLGGSLLVNGKGIPPPTIAFVVLILSPWSHPQQRDCQWSRFTYRTTLDTLCYIRQFVTFPTNRTSCMDSHSI